MKLQRGGETLKSKDALYKRLQELRDNAQMYAALPPAEAAFLTECLNKANEYYDYPQEQPTMWFVRTQIIIGTHSEFVFRRADGTEENPSIKRLSMQKPLGGKSVKEAARHSIADQVIAYRNTQYFCADCRGCAGLEVHHDEPSFNTIWQQFLADKDEAAIGVHEHRSYTGVSAGYRLTEPYHSQFNVFHAAHAKLKMLCRGCHDKITYARK